jgi:hypothetical protein
MAKNIFDSAFEASAESEMPPAASQAQSGSVFDSAFMGDSTIMPVGAAPTEDKSVSRPFEQWVAGANKRQDIPVFSPAADFGLSSNQMTRLTGLILTSPDDERIRQGVKNIVPSAKFGKDEFGNLIAYVPTKDGVKTFYPNPSGLDLPTVGQIAGGAATGLLLRKPLGAIGLPVEGMTGMATLGGTEAGLTEGISSALANESYRLSAPITGAALGPAFVATTGLAGLAAGGISKALGPAKKVVGEAVDSLLRIFGKNPQRVVDQSGALKPEIRQALEQAGIDVNTVTQEFTAAVSEMGRRGVPPEQAIRWQQSQGLPVPVPLTRGEVSGNLGQQILEGEAQKGQAGDLARQAMESQRTQQAAAVQENIPAMQQRIAGDSPLVERGVGGEAAQASLVAQRNAQKAAYGKAYDTAQKGGPAFVDPQQSGLIASRITESMADFRPRMSPGAFGLQEEAVTMLKEGRSIGELMNLRKAITKLASSADGNERGAAGNLLRSLDKELLNQADERLLYGNPEAVKSWLDAIGQFKEFQQMWNTRGGLLSKLTEKSARDGQVVLNVAPEAAANAIFGSSITGVVGKPQLTRDLISLRNMLPTDQWNGVRQEFFLKLTDAATNTGKQGGITGVTFNKVWSDLKKKNPSLVKVMFTPDEVQMFNNFGATVSTISGSAKNTSNSSFAVGDLLTNVLRKIGGGQMGAFAGNVPVIKGISDAWSYGKVKQSGMPFDIPESPWRAGAMGALANTVGADQVMNTIWSDDK